MNRRRRISHRRKKRNPMAYLFGAGLTLIVLLAALPLLSAEGKPSAETDPVESLEPTWPSETAAPTKPTQPGPDCPEALRELLKRNPETYDFVAGYPGTYDLHADLTQDYTPGEIPHLLQWDVRWGYYPYGGSQAEEMMGLSGCGPTALSMVVIGLTGDTSCNPAVVAQYASEAGYVTESDGTAWALMSEGCAHFGLTA